MAKKSEAVIKISRKGLLLWAALVLFVACWMFVLGILVGRGQAPVDLNAGMLEEELKTWKADKAEKAQAEVDARTGANGKDKPELGFYKALKEGQKPVKRTPRKKVQPKAAPTPAKSPAPAKPAEKPKVQPKQAKQLSPKPKAAETKGRFTIQVAAVRQMDSAEKLVADLKKKGYPAYQVSVKVPEKGVWYRVRVGAYDRKGAADQMLKKLATDKVKGMIIGTQ